MGSKLAKKVLVIGWDAADWKVILPLVKAGKMPALKKLMDEGVWGNIATLEPPMSPMLWTSIATGKRAYDHGILNFVEPHANGNGIRHVSSTSRKVKAIWNILNQKGLKSNVVGWWPSHPAEPINGAMVSNLYQQTTNKITEPWPMLRQTVYPEEFKEDLKWFRIHPAELTGAHLRPFVPELEKIDISKDKVLLTVAKTIAHAATVHNATTYLMEKKPDWDFMAIYHDAIDHFSHACMRFHPPQLEGIPDKEFHLFKNVINAGYRFHDMMLARTLDLAGEDATVILLSDHGFHSDHLRPKRLSGAPAGPAEEHRSYGVICMKGPGIKKNEKIHGASIIDITPTILHLFGLPVGKDMEGKVLIQGIDSSEKVNYIDSWESVEGETGEHPDDMQEDPYAAQEALQQLIDLGYIDKPDEDKSKAIAKVTNESNYYLARNYMDAAKYREAISLLENLVENDKEAIRFNYKLIQCYLSVGELEKAEKMIELTRKRFNKEKNLTQLSLMEGMLFSSHGNNVQAEKRFNEVLLTAPSSIFVLLQLAKLKNINKEWEEAAKWLLYIWPHPYNFWPNNNWIR